MKIDLSVETFYYLILLVIVERHLIIEKESKQRNKESWGLQLNNSRYYLTPLNTLYEDLYKLEDMAH